MPFPGARRLGRDERFEGLGAGEDGKAVDGLRRDAHDAAGLEGQDSRTKGLRVGRGEYRRAGRLRRPPCPERLTARCFPGRPFQAQHAGSAAEVRVDRRSPSPAVPRRQPPRPLAWSAPISSSASHPAPGRSAPGAGRQPSHQPEPVRAAVEREYAARSWRPPGAPARSRGGM